MYQPFLLLTKVSMSDPIMPDDTEAMRIENFASLSKALLPENERTAMNIDMVKPIPASIPTPRIWAHVARSGKAERPDLTASHETTDMPIGFPTTNPSTMPIPSGVKSPEIMSA